MGAILVRVGNASRKPLDDVMDIQVVSTRTDTTVASVSDVPGGQSVRVDGLIERQPYLVKVFPMRYRPVAQFAFAGTDEEPTTVQLYSPLHPERVRAATFPRYDDVHPDLKRVLEVSTVEGLQAQGQALYDGLSSVQKAGLFNLFTKMSGFGFDDRRSVWSFVDRLFRVRADRIFADVRPALRDLVKSGVASERFREVSGSMHTPPLGYTQAGSFKTPEHYGNMQLTFFASVQPPLSFKVDADIDDAAGLGHAFQVIRNSVTQGTTHPYDIHQILVYRQEVMLPYDLA
ncbi:MAG TPA: hypothetical protein VIK60_02910 [Vicinamibacterales bacterium]